MSTKNFRKMVVLAVALVCVSAGYVWAEKLGLQEKLSKDVNIKLKDVTIAEALEKIGKKAGVDFVLSDEAAWKLPQGAATRLSVALDGPLAESMTEMLNVFFMRYAVGDEEITIYPRLELEHILGRPTARQLELLKDIYTKPIRIYIIGEMQRTINEALGQEVMILPISMHSNMDMNLDVLLGKNSTWMKSKEAKNVRGKIVQIVRWERRKDAKKEDETGRTYELATPITLAQLLDEASSEESVWYLSSIDFPGQVPEIRVVSSKDFREAKLDQIVDISFHDERVEAIIQRLANWTGMELFVYKKDPLWLDEEITVDMQNVKLRQALRNVVSTVDGESRIDVESNAIYLNGPVLTKEVAPKVAAPRTTRSRSALSEGYVGKISIPMDGGRYFIEFMLREKDLTEELKKLRTERMEEILGRLPEQEKSKKESE